VARKWPIGFPPSKPSGFFRKVTNKEGGKTTWLASLFRDKVCIKKNAELQDIAEGFPHPATEPLGL